MAQAHRLPPKLYWKDQTLLLTSYRQRKAVFARDGGKCAKCGALGVPWHADHEIPLHAIPPSVLFPEALIYWRISNLQTLCASQCHAAKSRLEGKTNAKVKRLIKKQAGEKKVIRVFRPCPKKWPKKKKAPFKSRHHKIVSYIKS